MLMLSDSSSLVSSPSSSVVDVVGSGSCLDNTLVLESLAAVAELATGQEDFSEAWDFLPGPVGVFFASGWRDF